MTKKDWQRHLAYEALVILGVLALLLFVCRLCPSCFWRCWGIIIATLRLLFLSSTQVRPLEPMPPGAHKPPAKTPEETQVSQTFGNLQVQITRQVREEYPNAGGCGRRPRRGRDSSREKRPPSCSTGREATGKQQSALWKEDR